ncbi:MAG: ribosome-associated translation inhibitor RaiA [Actinomycetota bacterium]|nr:ribosome-associated translation inhibitor RaiA [Actinomycetota bacterium]
METIVKGKNLEVTEALRNYTEEKVSKIGKLGLDFIELEVRLAVEKNPSIKKNQKVDLTLSGDGAILRAAERDYDMYAAIDKATNKMLRQIKKFHEKQIVRTHSGSKTAKYVLAEPGEKIDSSQIIRNKKVQLKPMDPEEAVLQMDMLGHDFFVFLNALTDRVCIAYRRSDEGHGIIETNR